MRICIICSLATNRLELPILKAKYSRGWSLSWYLWWNLLESEIPSCHPSSCDHAWYHAGLTHSFVLTRSELWRLVPLTKSRPMLPTATNSSADDDAPAISNTWKDSASAKLNASKDGAAANSNASRIYRCQSLTLFIDQSIIWRKIRSLCIISDVG